MKIVFYFEDNTKIEVANRSTEDVKRLISQFNNGHLMRVGTAYINPEKVFWFFVHKEEEEDL